jgi:transcriptional regulator with XRE-family HTH domain
MDDISTLTAVIGTKINEARAQRSLTFDQLARLSGVSKGMLVQIEQGKTNPSIGTLCKIANALGVAVSKFIETSEAPTVRVISPGDATQLWTGRNGSAGKLVVGFDNPSLIEFWSWHLVPGEWHDGVAHPAGTREILFIKAGELTLTIGGTASRARAGQTITFVADKPHRYANDGSNDVQMLMVVCEPGRGGQVR